MQIVKYDSKYKSEFVRLNTEWLTIILNLMTNTQWIMLTSLLKKALWYILLFKTKKFSQPA